VCVFWVCAASTWKYDIIFESDRQNVVIRLSCDWKSR